MMKRLISLLLAALMIAAALPFALADEVPPEEPAQDTEPAPAEPEPDPAPADPEPDPAQDTEPAQDPEPDYQPEGEPMTLEELTGAGEYEKPVTMYVYTDNGGTLNVRSAPFIKKGNEIGKLAFGAEVKVLGTVVIDPDWVVIEFSKAKDGIGYVLARYLVYNKPASKPSGKKSDEELKRERDKKELDNQKKSYAPLAEPQHLVVRTTRTSGWINFRVGPGVASNRIASLPDGYELTAIGETAKWWEATDPKTGKTGFISKTYTVVVPVEAVPVKQSLGTLNVNGEFALQCALPEGYTMQVVNMLGTRIVVSILSEDVQKPMLYLSIAYSDIYSDIERMNDMSAEDLAVLEASYTDMDEVEISYRETAYGTKLLVAREVGSGTDFVDILTVYKGYNIEFVMTPNENGTAAELTEEQIQMCIDFLSELDFVPVNLTRPAPAAGGTVVGK